MTAEKQFHNAITTASEYPTGTTVYHRGTGQRGLIVGYMVYADGSCRIMVDWAQRESYDAVMPCSLSVTPMPDYGPDASGDEWKNPEES